MPERYRGHDPRDRFKGSPAAPSIKSTENGFSRCARSINYRAMRPGGEGGAEGGRGELELELEEESGREDAHFLSP